MARLQRLGIDHFKIALDYLVDRQEAPEPEVASSEQSSVSLYAGDVIFQENLRRRGQSYITLV